MMWFLFVFGCSFFGLLIASRLIAWADPDVLAERAPAKREGSGQITGEDPENSATPTSQAVRSLDEERRRRGKGGGCAS